MTEKYRFEELDRETRDYLLYARDQEGKGMPGIYVARSNYWPLIGLIVGFGIIIATLIGTFPPTDPPAKEAMLQTAGLLLGGWLIVAAVRIWTAGKSGRYIGYFTYADPETLYQATGSTVAVTDLADLREAKAVQNFNEGKYKDTSITLKLGKDREYVKLQNEERGRRLTVYLNAVAYMKDGGEDGNDKVLQKLSPEAMGAVAKKVAKTGEFPTNPGRSEEGESIRVPQPRREGRASFGLFGILAVLLIGTGMFFGLMVVNYPFRDEVVFARIKDLPPKEQPYFLRQYLAEPNFKAHRDEAQKLLNERYENGVRANVQGSDADMKRGLGEVVLGLKDKPVPVASLLAVEEASPPGQAIGATGREKSVQTKLADKWGATIGDELVAFATLEDPNKPGQADKTVPAMIDVRWKFMPQGSIEYTIKFRKSPAEEPVVVAAGTQPAQGDEARTVDAMGDQIVAKTIGLTKMRPAPVIEDF